MKDKNVEEQLRKTADKISPKNFAQRRQEIKRYIDNADIEADRQIFAEQNTVMYSGGSAGIVNANNKKHIRLISIILALIIGAALAIILPLTLYKKPVEYFDHNKLNRHSVSEEEFYNGLKSSHYSIFNLSECNVEYYALWYASDEKTVLGGTIEILDGDEGYASISFFDLNVKNLSPIFFQGNEEYNTGYAVVKYSTTETDGIYEVKGSTQYKGLNYLIDYVTANKVTDLFDSIFTA